LGGGPIGLALLTAQFYAPAQIIAIDGDDHRLKTAHTFGAAACINVAKSEPVAEVRRLTDSEGVYCAIEAVGVPSTFELCEEIIARGDTIANVGVHGEKADFHLETLWDRNINITTRLVDTVSTSMLMKTVRAGRLDPKRFITHRFTLDRILDAYDTFGDAADTNASKVVIEASEVLTE
jgi:alcohol dehydrogenase